MVITLSETSLESPDGTVKFKHPPNYKILQVAGYGAFGLTVIATIKGDSENVAIKKLKPHIWRTGSEFRYIKGFTREAVILTHASNPHVVHLKTIYFEMGQGDPLDSENVIAPYIVMENCGQNISQYIRRNNTTIKRMDFAAKIVYGVACGLNFLESFEIYHRDLKPENICINTTGQVKIIDLGLARKSPEQASNVTGGISTVCYRSPNFLLGMKYKEANDRWSLGCIFGYVLSRDNKHIFNQGFTKNSVEYGTLSMIVDLIGNPGQDFIKSLEQEKNKPKTKVDIHLCKAFIEIVNKRERINKVHKLYEHYRNYDQYINGMALLNGLLEWEPEKRISIADILSHPFVEVHRNIDNEGLPSEDVCNKVKEELDEHEKELMKLSRKENTDSHRGKADARKYLFEYVADQFGYDKDLKEYFPYGVPKNQ